MNCKTLLTSALIALGTAGLSAPALSNHTPDGRSEDRTSAEAQMTLFRMLDLDKNGRLDEEEIRNNAILWDQYRQLDTNNDRELSIGEFKHIHFEGNLH